MSTLFNITAIYGYPIEPTEETWPPRGLKLYKVDHVTVLVGTPLGKVDDVTRTNKTWMAPRMDVCVRSGDELGLYSDEVCSAGTCARPPGHGSDGGNHSQFDGPKPDDAVPHHWVPSRRGIEAVDTEAKRLGLVPRVYVIGWTS